MLYTLKNDYLKAEISDLGAEIQSLKKSGCEFIWNGNPDYWPRRAPVLFPEVGRFKGMQYVHEQKLYFMGQHGFARDKVFQCIKASETSIDFRLSADAETLKSYPFHFTLDISYRLERHAIHVLWKVSHEDKSPMYFSIGAHPAFAHYPEKGGYMDGFFIDFHQSGPLALKKLNQDGYVIPESFWLPVEAGCIEVSPELFRGDVLILDASALRKASLLKPDKTPLVTVDFKAPLLGIWAPSGDRVPFLCIEPWYGCNDSTDFTGALKDRPYMQKLNPGQVFTSAYTITAA